MNYIRIKEISSNQTANNVLAKKIIREAVFDDAIYVFIDVPEEITVWEYPITEPIAEKYLAFNIFPDIERKEGIERKDIKSIRIDPKDLIGLVKSDEILIQSSNTGVFIQDMDVDRLRLDEFVENNESKLQTMTPSGEDGLGWIGEDWKFYFFESNKTDKRFESTRSIICSLNNLQIGINLTNVKNAKVIRDYIPSSFCLPDWVQTELKYLPVSGSQLPKYLRLLLDFFVSEFGKTEEMDVLDKSGAIVTKVQIYRLKEGPQKSKKELVTILINKFENKANNQKKGRSFGENTIEEIAELIFPDYMNSKNAKYPDSCSKTIPSLFMMICCLYSLQYEYQIQINRVDLMYKPIYKFDPDSFANILYRINQPKVHESLDGFEIGCFNNFCARFPEISYLRFVKFTKAQAKTAARLCEFEAGKR